MLDLPPERHRGDADVRRPAAAPPFEVTDLEGKNPVKLADYAGKVRRVRVLPADLPALPRDAEVSRRPGEAAREPGPGDRAGLGLRQEVRGRGDGERPEALLPRLSRSEREGAGGVRLPADRARDVRDRPPGNGGAAHRGRLAAHRGAAHVVDQARARRPESDPAREGRRTRRGVLRGLPPRAARDLAAHEARVRVGDAGGARQGPRSRVPQVSHRRLRTAGGLRSRSSARSTCAASSARTATAAAGRTSRPSSRRRASRRPASAVTTRSTRCTSCSRSACRSSRTPRTASSRICRSRSGASSSRSAPSASASSSSRASSSARRRARAVTRRSTSSGRSRRTPARSPRSSTRARRRTPTASAVTRRASSEPAGFPTGGPTLAGVGCESCHGPGKRHVEDKGATSGTILALTDKCDSCAILLICGTCHDDANDKGFEFAIEAKLAKIRHGFREKKRRRRNDAPERARDDAAAIRDSLRELVADGVDFVPAAGGPGRPRERRLPRAAAPRPPATFQPRVAPLAAPTQIGDAARRQADAASTAIRAEIGDCRRCKLVREAQAASCSARATPTRAGVRRRGPGRGGGQARRAVRRRARASCSPR